MTVSTSTSFNSYAGNGSTTSFAYAFKIFQDSNLVVTLVNDTTGVETTQTLTTDYTVTGAGSDSGGNVVFGTAPALGNTVVIRRVLPVTQETNYVPNDPFPAEAHEDALDKLTMLVQQEVASSELAVQFPEGDVGSGINNILPSVTGRADKLIKFGLDGAVEVIPVSDLSSAIIGANYAVDTFTGTGSTTVYTLSATPGSKANTAIYIDGVYQAKANYSVSGSTLTFTTAPPLNSAIEIVIGDAIPAGAATTASAVSYTQGGTGAVTTNVQAKLRETVSVKDFGAVGDGVADDTAAIQAAMNASYRVYFPEGTYIVSSPLTADKTGFKAFGESENVATIKASSGFSGSYMFNLGNGTVSRYFNEIRNLSLDGNSVSSLVGIYFNRVNNQSKIMHNQFENFHTAIKAENLALANTCCFNKFGSGANTIDIHLVGAAGNSWLIMDNYFAAGGYVYLDNSMTDVKYVNNVSDNGSYLFSDGVSGQRGIHVVGNRFEGGTDTHVKLGLVRGCYINDNFFQGNGTTPKAIELTSSSAVQYATVANNFFENYTTNYVDSSIPNNRLELYGNHSNDSYSATLDYDTNTTRTTFEDTIEAVNFNVKGGGPFPIGSDEINFGPNKESLFIISKALTGGGSTDNVLTITTDGSRGCYTIIADIMVSNTPNSSAVAAGHARFSWTHITDNGGNSDDSAVTTEKALVAIADAGGSRDVTSLTAAITTTSGTVSTFSLTCGTVGSTTDVQAHCSIKMIYHQYSAKPAVAVV